MFDTVGHHHDEDAARRGAAAVILLSVGGGAATALLLALTAWTATELVVSAPEPEMDFHEFVVETVIEEPLPSVPAPPAIARGVRAPDDLVPTVAPVPEEFVDPKELTDVDSTVADTQEAVGDRDGIGDDPNGVHGGRTDGVEGGTGDSAGTGFATVHRTAVRLRRPVTPEYPSAARDMNLGTVDCRVRVLIEDNGHPLDLEFLACPAVFHGSVRDAVMDMRWVPYRVGRQPSRARFDIRFQFEPGR